jgi:hypothetical protein
MFLRVHMTVDVCRLGIQCREFRRVRLRRTGLYAAAWEGLGGRTKPPFG